MNVLKERKHSSISTSSSKSFPSASGATRSVPSHLPLIDTTVAENLNHSENRGLLMPHYTTLTPKPNQIATDAKLPIYISNATIFNGTNKGTQRQVSTEYSPPLPYAGKNSNGSPLLSPQEDRYSVSGVLPWNSAVGRAGLGGKSGRVIERLMGENDMLKRDLNIERLRAEEHKHALRMAEGKMEAMTAEFEGKLHDAAINKTLLKRKERQLTDLRLQVETEKSKANAAIESERIWKEEIEKVEKKAKRDVEDALNYATMMEARNNAMTNHWKERSSEVNRAVVKLSKEIGDIVLERKQDDERLNTLQSLCDQQETQLTQIVRECDAMAKKYEEYKLSQEEALRDIKTTASGQEEKSERLLAETLSALNELKWALGVKKNERD